MSAIDAGIAALAGATLTAAGNHRENRLAYERSRILMNEQNQMNIDNWRMENAYNSDVAQVARRRAAGLNPVTIDGGSNAGQIAGTTPTAQQGAQVPDFSAAVSSALQARQIELQQGLVQSQINKNNADADSVRGNTAPARTDMQLKQSVSALNDATRGLLAKQGLSETTRNDILKLEKSLKELDLKRLNSNFTVKAPNGKVISGPLYMADAIRTGAELALQFENISSVRLNSKLMEQRINLTRHQSRITKAEADTYFQSLKATLANVWSQVRKNSSSTDAQNFENSVNKELKDFIISHRRSMYTNQTARNRGEEAWENAGGAAFARFISSISPFTSLTTSY
ncbi:MAG: DNA pilot protein [Microviridae sp.]|nr:MAG: DNA pilot protein [Microviridae sp.]